MNQYPSHEPVPWWLLPFSRPATCWWSSRCLRGAWTACVIEFSEGFNMWGRSREVERQGRREWMEGKGGRKFLIGYPSLSVCWFPVEIWQSALCVAVRRALTSLCSHPVSQNTLIRSDLGMTHHMPAPHTPSDLCLPLRLSPWLHHSCISAPHPPTTTHPLSRCSFVLFLSHIPPELHIFTYLCPMLALPSNL